MPNRYYIYILGSISGTLYVGMTSELVRRVNKHKQRIIPGFTNKYEIDRVLYFEETSDVKVAIEREKEIKAWRREKKKKLIDTMNPEWRDLSDDWVED
jgi:putative endonuclease